MDSHLAGAHYCLAAAYLAIGDNEKLMKAMDELRTEIRLFPKNAIAYAALGHLEANRHNLAEAEKNLSRAVALNAKNPDTFLYLGQLYSETNRPAEAETALRTSIRLTTDPSRNRYDVQKAHYLLGRLLIQSGNPEEGKKELEASKALLNANLSRDRERLSDYLEENPGMGQQSGIQVSGVAEQSGAEADPEAQHQVDEFRRQIGQRSQIVITTLEQSRRVRRISPWRCASSSMPPNESQDGWIGSELGPSRLLRRRVQGSDFAAYAIHSRASG